MNTDKTRVNLDLDKILHPAQAFDHPSEVVNDPDLTLQEKRAILASWASDACAIEAAPDLRAVSPGKQVHFDEIMDALQTLDRQARELEIPYREVRRRRGRSNDDRHGAPI